MKSVKDVVVKLASELKKETVSMFHFYGGGMKMKTPPEDNPVELQDLSPPPVPKADEKSPPPTAPAVARAAPIVPQMPQLSSPPVDAKIAAVAARVNPYPYSHEKFKKVFGIVVKLIDAPNAFWEQHRLGFLWAFAPKGIGEMRAVLNKNEEWCYLNGSLIDIAKESAGRHDNELGSGSPRSRLSRFYLAVSDLLQGSEAFIARNVQDELDALDRDLDGFIQQQNQPGVGPNARPSG